MNTGGWITMVASLVFVWGLVIWCFWRVMKSPEEEKVPTGFGA
ncbi:MAG: hypothetical protein ACT4OZ_03785 [Gemmatimonadota bacterium]